jgi:hypothetical protein
MDNVTTFLEEANKILTSDRQTFLAYDARQAFQLMQHLAGVSHDKRVKAGYPFQDE